MVIARQPKRWAGLPVFAVALALVAGVGSLAAIDAAASTCRWSAPPGRRRSGCSAPPGQCSTS
ncbi:hypothetical protein ACFQX6_29440 [Streptosporangium lutulentum]